MISTHTSLLPAQMQSHHQLIGAIGENVPDGFRFVQRRRFSFELPINPSIPELSNLQVELDHQSLQHATGVKSEHDLTSEANLAKTAALKLSEPLTECTHTGRSRFQQAQFRALIASLALLHHCGVAALDRTPFDKLKGALSGQFVSIAYQSRRDTTEIMVHTTNLYLIILASQYMSFIRRGDSVVPSIAGPAIQIFFATLAIVGGQYNHAQRILEAFNELLALWQRPQAKYRALCVLQEYIRLVVSLDRESLRESTRAAEREQVKESVALVVSTLLDKMRALLAEEGRGRPKIGGQWHKTRAAIGRGPPDLDQGWFYYGLLDCAAQISVLADTNNLRDKGIFGIMRELIFGDVPQAYRLKAMEVLLSCNSHNETYTVLKKEMEEKLRGETRAALLQELETVRKHPNQNRPHGLQSYLSPLLTGLPTVKFAQSEPASSIPRINTLESLPASYLEQDLVGSRPWKSKDYQLHIPERGHGLFKSKPPYEFAGLSTDCKHAVLYSSNHSVVFRLEPLNPAEPDPFPDILSKGVTDERILDITLGRRSMIIITNKCLLALDITRAGSPRLGMIPHGNFDYSGITCHEDDTHLVIMLGQRRNDKDGYRGRINIIKFRFDGNGKSYHTATISLPDHDCPKLLSYGAATKTLVCITRIPNKVMAWELDNDFSPLPMHPFNFVHRYTQETRVTGITSASTFQGPSGNIYLACTTSPSSERYRNGGEWPFISPLSYRRGPELRPPNAPFHNLEHFKEHPALTVGCVSTKHGVLAVLDGLGKIFILSLKSHEEGGICGEEKAERLSKALHRQEKPSTSCLRFDPDGERLFAIDPKGKIIITDFERCDRKQAL